MSPRRLLPVVGQPSRPRRYAFYSLHARTEASGRTGFSAYAPRAMAYFAGRYGIPIIDKPADMTAFDTILFSLLCFRDFYDIARLAHHKRPGQEWIAGGNACATPVGVSWIMDYVWVGDCRASFPKILAGEREMPGMVDGRHPDRPVRYIDEDLDPEPLTPGIMEMSKGCPRRCLFCIHPWRHRYQEAPQEAVEAFVRRSKGRLGLMSNSSDDVSYYDEVSEMLEAYGKHDMTVSNAVQSFSAKMARARRGEVLFGAEGMSERLRWVVNKPIGQALLREKVALGLAHGNRMKLVYQFNLPGEEPRDFDDLEDDIAYWVRGHRKGTLVASLIPNQPSAHTPFQWVVPRYSVEMGDRIMETRKRYFGSGKTGLGVALPTPLGPRRWFAQVIAEWLPITPAVADAVDALPPRLSTPQMVAFLASRGIHLPTAFLHRDQDTVFPWSNVLTTGDDPDKWKRYQQMIRKLASERFTGA